MALAPKPSKLVQVRLPDAAFGYRYLRLKMAPPGTGEPGSIDVDEHAVPVQYGDRAVLAFDHSIDVPSARTRLGKIGFCIYCGAPYRSETSEIRPTDEHIIPEGIGGSLTIDEASCDPCAVLINKYEGGIQNSLMFSPRRKLGIRGKKRAKSHLHTLTAFVDNKEIKIELPLEEHPAILILPTFRQPGILTPRPQNESGVTGAWLTRFNDAETTFQRGITYATPPMDLMRICQFLAKIAHSYAASRYGITSFSPDRTPIVNGAPSPIAKLIKSDFNRTAFDLSVFDYIGGFGHTAFAASEHTHEIGIKTVSNELFDYDEVHIRLFGSFGTPVFRVITTLRRHPML